MTHAPETFVHLRNHTEYAAKDAMPRDARSVGPEPGDRYEPSDGGPIRVDPYHPFRSLFKPFLKAS